MSVTSADLRDVVHTLFPDSESLEDESLRRACINRCYYATYHHLLEAIEQNYPTYIIKGDNRTFGNTGTHAQVFYVFDDIWKNSNKKNRVARQISIKFKDFLSKRHQADYYLDDDFTEYDFQQALNCFDVIPQLVDKLIEE